MCLAISSKVIKSQNMTGTVDVYGARRDINPLPMPQEVFLGDYVLVHADFVLQKVESAIAGESLRLIREIREKSADKTLLNT
jgi:hydrogenase expression/formation protein HypC